MGQGSISTFGKKGRYFVLEHYIGGEKAKIMEYLTNSELFVRLWGNSRGHNPLELIPFISGEVEKLKQNLSPDHMVCGNTRFFRSLTATLDVTQRFLLITEGAVRRVFFAPLMKKGTAWEL